MSVLTTQLDLLYISKSPKTPILVPMLEPAHLLRRSLFSGNHTCPLPKDESSLELKAEPIVGSLTLQHVLAIVSHRTTSQHATE